MSRQTLGEACSRLSSGKSILSNKVLDKGLYPVIGGNGRRGFTNSYNFEGRCAVIGRQGAACGNVHYFSGKAYMTEHAVVACAANGNDSHYLAYLLSTMNLGRLSGQSAQPGLSVRTLSKQFIDLPSLKKQRQVVELLGSLDEKIEVNARANGYLEELLDAEFTEMQAEADDTWKDASLLDIANYKNGLAMQKFRPQPGDKGLPVLKIRELGQGECGPDAEWCSSDIEDSVHVRDGDLIFSWSGTLMLNFWAGGDAGLNQHLFKVTSDKYPCWFYYMWTKHHMRRFIAMAKDRATTMGHIKRSALANAAVKIPSSDVLCSQTKAMQPLIDEIVGLKIQSRKLANLRDALLPKLMSGEIDVSKVYLTQPNSHLCER